MSDANVTVILETGIARCRKGEAPTIRLVKTEGAPVTEWPTDPEGRTDVYTGSDGQTHDGKRWYQVAITGPNGAKLAVGSKGRLEVVRALAGSKAMLARVEKAFADMVTAQERLGKVEAAKPAKSAVKSY